MRLILLATFSAVFCTATALDCNGKIKKITCKGKGVSLETCDIGDGNTIIDVEVTKIISKEQCLFHQNPAPTNNTEGGPGIYGWTPGAIWVARSCRAKFKICYKEPECDGKVKKLNCNSNGGKIKKCKAPGTLISRPLVVKKKSRSCDFHPGDPPDQYMRNDPGIFGYHDDYMWSLNCKAKFQVCTSDVDKCSPNPCLNGGKCNKKKNGYKCRCPYGYDGPHCENRNCICSATGDPHYRMYDGEKMHYQGECRYVLTKISNSACGSFEVQVENRRAPRNPSVSVTQEMYVYIAGDEIKVGQQKEIQINSINIFVGEEYLEPDYTIRRGGNFVEIENHCGMVAMFDGKNKAIVKINATDGPGAVGICGNCNGDATDDLVMSNGTDVSGIKGNFKLIGDSWWVPQEGDDAEDCLEGPASEECPVDTANMLRESPTWCGFAVDSNGPFSQCTSMMSMEDINKFIEDCVFDLCVFRDDLIQMQNYMCTSAGNLQAMCYANFGKEIDPIDFRNVTNCPLTCGEHMIYVPRVEESNPVCQDPDRHPLSEDTILEEGCVCEEGYLYEVGADMVERCILSSQCGCSLPDGSQLPVNATYLDEDCMQKFTCNVGPQPDVELLGGCDDSKHMVCMASDGVYDCVCDEDYQMDMDGNCVAEPECEGKVKIRKCKSRNNEEKVCKFKENISSVSVKKLFSQECEPKSGPQPQGYSEAYYYFKENKLIVDNGCRAKFKVCLEDKDDCASNPCLNGGICIDKKGKKGYKCECLDEWKGKNCEKPKNKDDCASNPCQNGGTCIDKKGNKGYKCECLDEWKGKNCEKPKNQDDCASNPCQNGGTCIDKKGNKGYKCECLDEWKGKNCEKPKNKDDCASNPCQNGGTCIDKKGNKGYKCECLDEWKGKNCEKPKNQDDCASNPCLNGGTCIDKKGNKGYKCECLDEWKGKNCEKPKNQDDCASNPCQNGGTCIDKKGNKGYKCECLDEWKGKNCEKPKNKDRCKNNPCRNGGTCINEEKKFKCVCTQEFEGKRCQKPKEKDTCSPNPCENDGTCISKRNGYKCECKEGWKGKNCQKPEEEDDCNPNPCENDGTCINKRNGYKCECKEGWKGKNCQKPVEEDDCNPNPCENDGTCINKRNGYKCECKEGWKGKNCQKPDDDDDDDGDDDNDDSGRGGGRGGHGAGSGSGHGQGGGDDDDDDDNDDDYHHGGGGGSGGRGGHGAGGGSGHGQGGGGACKNNPCKHGGTCTDKGNGHFECCCPAGWTGKYCSERDLPPKPSGSQKECIEDSDPRGTMYFGSRDFTTSGRKCQPWASQYPHPHAYHDKLATEENFCRNRVHGIKGLAKPWCFTSDPDKRWEYCDNIPHCSDPDETFPAPPSNPGCYNRGDKGESYAGPVNFAANGRRCEKWEDYPDNYCRNPGSAKNNPWCWVDGRMEDCDIDICALPPPAANEDTCVVDTFVSVCESTVKLTGDCYYRHQLYQKCDFTVVRASREVFDVYMPMVTKELRFQGAGGSHRYTNENCDATFEVSGYNQITIKFPICGWCAKKSYESFMSDIVDGTNSCPAP